MEVLLSEDDSLSFNFSASVLGRGQQPNQFLSWQCSPVLSPFWFFWAVSSQMTSVPAVETSSKSSEGLSLLISEWFPLSCVGFHSFRSCVVYFQCIWSFCLPEFGRHSFL